MIVLTCSGKNDTGVEIMFRVCKRSMANLKVCCVICLKDELLMNVVIILILITGRL